MSTAIKLGFFPIILAWFWTMECHAEDPASPQGFDLTPILSQDTFWSLDRDKGLLGALKGGPFRWTSQEKTEIRGADKPMVFQGLPVSETIFRFKGEKLSEVFLSFYNRGDVGDKTEAWFKELVDKTKQILNSQSGVQGQDIEGEISSTKLRNLTAIWLSPKVSYRLDTATSQVEDEKSNKLVERPEFINLTIFPGGLTQDDVVVHRQAVTEFVEFEKRVQHPQGGDVVITSVPMVDQGQKGYCAVATMERILKYYGSDVNEHELAQQANSSGKGGTDPESLLKAMRAMSGMVDLRINEFNGIQKFDNDHFITMIDSYNSVATRVKGKPIELAKMNNMNDIFNGMQVDVIREWKLKSPQQEDSYFNYVQETINKGWPLAWSVYLGWVPEKPAVGRGGHIRTIIGYNPDTREILYSDSWGAGHEKKRMSLDDAYIITMGLYVVEPKI